MVAAHWIEVFTTEESSSVVIESLVAASGTEGVAHALTSKVELSVVA
jgi:hypothetical protein